jgi:hypothetical protein
MVAREIPADEVLASWQHVEQRALDLRAAGVEGSLQELRVRAYLDLLQERDTRTIRTGPDQPGAPQSTPGPGSPQEGSDEPGGTGDGHNAAGDPDGPSDGLGGPGGPGAPGSPGGNGGNGRGPRSGPAGTGPDGPGGGARRPGRDTGPSIAALVTITVPWATMHGGSDTPGEAAGFGLLDAGTARDLVAAAARNPDTRWCVTALHPDGTAAAHACAPGRHSRPPDPRTLKFNAVIRGPCHHAQAQHSYRPSRQLRHLVSARNTCCTAPGCSQPAASCDLDHTTPWHHGGPTYPCNLAPYHASDNDTRCPGGSATRSQQVDEDNDGRFSRGRPRGGPLPSGRAGGASSRALA